MDAESIEVFRGQYNNSLGFSINISWVIPIDNSESTENDCVAEECVAEECVAEDPPCDPVTITRSQINDTKEELKDIVDQSTKDVFLDFLRQSDRPMTESNRPMAEVDLTIDEAIPGEFANCRMTFSISCKARDLSARIKQVKEIIDCTLDNSEDAVFLKMRL